MFNSNSELTNAASTILTTTPEGLTIQDPVHLRETFIDQLIKTAVFSSDEELKTKSRKLIFDLAPSVGVHSRSIYSLYSAFGQGDIAGFTIPAINIRTLTYDMARLIFRLMIKYDIGAVVFEIARSEIEYTDQRPEEYSLCVLAAAIKEHFTGPVFLQGDHYQLSKRRFEEDRESEIERIKALIDESLAAQFKNIDIDASTLVDLSQDTLEKQQHNNADVTALLTQHIRNQTTSEEPISIGAEIGHIGGKNSTDEEFEAFMQAFHTLLPTEHLSKISVQTGSSHGGTVLPDGSIQEVAIDFSVLEKISKVARETYKIGGAVQHGASTLPLSYFENFVRSNTLEIHLATGFQNTVYETMPHDLKTEIYTWIKEHLQDEKEEGWNEEQFIYKTRKKAFGPFKQLLWDMSETEKQPLLQALETQLTTIFEKLRIFGTKGAVSSYFT